MKYLPQLFSVFCLSAFVISDVWAENPAAEPAAPSPYTAIVREDKSVAFWDFQSGAEATVGDFVVTPHGEIQWEQPGPRPSEFPLFAGTNQSMRIGQSPGFLKIADPGDKSPLDFDLGDSITLEAWVQPDPLDAGRYYYVVGKGRTGNKGFEPHNQNYALRLQGQSSGGAAITFLFRSRGETPDWHRWTSTTAMPIGDGWHHVAVTYTFGKKDSVRGYIDGNEVKGKWDMGGATANAPVVDNDEVWIGSSMGGNASSTFNGSIDEIAIHKTALTPERIRARYRYEAPQPVVDLTRIPENKILVDVFEKLPDTKSWSFRPPQFVESYTIDGFTFLDIPKKYSDKAIQIDRSNPFLLRAYGYITLPEGPRKILVRCRNASKLYLDDKLIAETKFHDISGSAHGRVFEIDNSLAPNIEPLHRGDTEAVAEIVGDGKKHLFRFDFIVGGQQRRPEPGETGVYIATVSEDFAVLSETMTAPLTKQVWPDFKVAQRQYYVTMNAQRRRDADKESQYWQYRHELAKKSVEQAGRPAVPAINSETINNDVDRFIAAKLGDNNQELTQPSSDLEFLRRVTIDITGVVPTTEQIHEFEADTKPGKRERAIDRLLSSPQWADNWVGYWQDVLAENPNIINPTLNNTGPFRWWIHESFLDNKPFDRFATELTMMEGSTYFGGPGGFEMASQNDAPMAAKAHIVSQAFLALQMKCARCHDAPAHAFLQSDLFGVAAMLKRGPQQVPLTSTIPGGDAVTKSLSVQVTLKPGEKIAPAWPFEEIAAPAIPSGVLRNPKDERERLAALITLPHNRRFAQTVVNRLWKRYLGYGIVEPVDDWEYAEPSHPELLDYLADELLTHGYDLKHVARLIFNSQTYQRRPRGVEVVPSSGLYLFASPIVRRLEAEQLVDSLFVVSGKLLDAGPMNIDIDTARTFNSSLNLGEPTRAWQFTSMSNERDRPSLSLPFAQPFVSALETFGWRSSRQDPITERETAPTVLQPAVMINGNISRRTSQLSDDSWFTATALQAESLESLIDECFLRVLTRRPSEKERELFTGLLAEGFADRKVDAPITRKRDLPRTMVGWSNHLDPAANRIKLELEKAVDEGDPPTRRLTLDWRERMEDMVWILTNTPEFVFLP